jgi:hypothetical protein
LKRKAGQADQIGLAPATLRQLFEAYGENLRARGKGEEAIARAAQTATVLEPLTPELIDKPVSRLTEADIFAFRRARAERPCFTPRPADPDKKPACPAAPAKPSTINRDLRILRTMLKLVRCHGRRPAPGPSSSTARRKSSCAASARATGASGPSLTRTGDPTAGTW